MQYQLEITSTAQSSLADLPEKIKRQISQKIEALAINPRPPKCKKLEMPGEYYRIRSGDYRVIYEIHDTILLILIVRIAHRREVYRGLA